MISTSSGVGDALTQDDAAAGIVVNIADGRLGVTVTQLDGTVRWNATGTLRVDETGEAAAVDVDGLCRHDEDATGLRVVKVDGTEDVVAETLGGVLTLVGADANVTVVACGKDAQINDAAGRTTLHSACDGTLVASEGTAVVVDGTVTVQSVGFFSLTGARVTTVRVSGALVDFVGFVHGVAGTSLAYTTDAASRVIVLGVGCRMSFASETDASGTVAFNDPEGDCVGCCAAH